MSPKSEKPPVLPDELQTLPGRIYKLEIPVASMPTQGWVNIPIIILRGKNPGPSIWLSAAVHGDELNGIEIIQQVCQEINPKDMSGTIYACPILNVYGFLHQSRYLPDRRDLNRSFPGSAKGSLAARIASFFMSQVVDRCTMGIDLHTAGENYCNEPQVRANLDDERTKELAEAFGAPITLHSSLRDGSLRYAAAKRGKITLVYEAGAAKRFDRESIKIGHAGIYRVLAALNILSSPTEPTPTHVRIARRSHWLRSSTSGIFNFRASLGKEVSKGEILGQIVDSFGTTVRRIRATDDGLIIGVRENPLVYRGDALIHLASR